MTEANRKRVLAIESILLLLPLTLFLCLLIPLAYVTYPQELRLLQVMFDAGILLKVLGVVAAWRLTWGYLRYGRAALRRSHPSWVFVLLAAVLMGLVAAGIAVEQLFWAVVPAVRVGFALLAPAVLLLPMCLHFLWEQCRAQEHRQ